MRKRKNAGSLFFLSQIIITTGYPPPPPIHTHILCVKHSESLSVKPSSRKWLGSLDVVPRSGVMLLLGPGSPCICLMRSWFIWPVEKNASPHLTVQNRTPRLPSQLSTTSWVACFCWHYHPPCHPGSKSPFSLPFSSLPPPQLPPLNKLSVVNSAFLLSLMSVASFVLIAAVLIQVLITSGWDCTHWSPEGSLCLTPISLMHQVNLLDTQLHHVLPSQKIFQWLLYSLQDKVYIHSRWGLCNVVPHYSFHAPHASTKSNYFFLYPLTH